VAKLTIKWGGIPVADDGVEEVYREMIENLQRGDVYRFLSTNNIFLRVRVGIREGDLKAEDVTFIYNDIVIVMDQDGHTDNWPRGFCDLHEKLYERLF
jgi:hypothetical protein